MTSSRSIRASRGMRVTGSAVANGCKNGLPRLPRPGARHSTRVYQGILEPATRFELVTCALRVRQAASRRSEHLSPLSKKPHYSYDLFRRVTPPQFGLTLPFSIV